MSTQNKVGIREFANNIYKWIKRTPLIITVHGKDKYKVERVED